MAGIRQGSAGHGGQIIIDLIGPDLLGFTGLLQFRNLFLLAADGSVALFRGQTELVRARRETDISIVLAQQNAVFGT